MMNPTKARLLIVARRYSELAGVSMARISTIAANDGKVLGRLEVGRDITTETHDRILSWLSENWPSHEPWPDDVARPAVRDAA